jgi:hypothetical protein
MGSSTFTGRMVTPPRHSAASALLLEEEQPKGNGDWLKLGVGVFVRVPVAEGVAKRAAEVVACGPVAKTVEEENAVLLVVLVAKTVEEEDAVLLVVLVAETVEEEDAVLLVVLVAKTVEEEDAVLLVVLVAKTVEEEDAVLLVGVVGEDEPLADPKSVVSKKKTTVITPACVDPSLLVTES